MDIDASTIADFLPIPDTMAPVTDPDKTESANSLSEQPTSSHALAMADHDQKGAAQEAHDREVKDLGWTTGNDKIPNPLVGGMPNEDLWVLVRRFDKVSRLFIEHLLPFISSRVDVIIKEVRLDLLTASSKCTTSKSTPTHYLGNWT